MTSSEILKLIAARHTDDVFVHECKGGPTWGSEHDRLDAWAMRKSWSRPCAWGYEIKVSRGDWLKDQKWQVYLPYCNQFYFVCPPKVILPEEVPAEAGLLYVASTARSLFTKKKAPHRQVEIPESLYQYLLMNRVRVLDRGERPQTPVDQLEYWREWLAKRAESRSIGHRVSQELARYVDRIECENSYLRSENRALALFRERLIELGVNPQASVQTWTVEQAVEKLRGSVPREFKVALRAVERGIAEIWAVLTPEDPQPLGALLEVGQGGGR